LSKALLEGCNEFKDLLEMDRGLDVPMHLRALVHYLHFYLTGDEALPKINHQIITTPREPVLKGHATRKLEITIMLPKASLLGAGVSFKGAFGYDEKHEGLSGYSMTLTLHELRVPTLIGVNPNERLAKQMVVATVEMDRYDRMVDAYCRLEELVVKVCGQCLTSPETLLFSKREGRKAEL
jgi:hypothetical protein